MFRWHFFYFLALPLTTFSQISWQNVDSLYQPLPKSVHVFFTDAKIDTETFRAFYVVADLKDKKLKFTTDTTYKRRLTPSQFYQKNKQPLVVVNGTFFSFETNRNLNLVVKDGRLISYNTKSVRQKVEDSTREILIYRSALGINRKRNADVAWTRTDSTTGSVFMLPYPRKPGLPELTQDQINNKQIIDYVSNDFYKWKMKTAIGGGPVLLQDGNIRITNEFERMFSGKAINDKHPRTAMGYTKDNKLIILVIQGRSESASGATLVQEAQILKVLGCVEALNLDGGGSSCLLINGKETIKPSDKGGQRAVPAVFIIKKK